MGTLCRLALNTARRFPYPFAPALSRGMDVPLTAITSLIAINQATGLLGVLFGPFGDRFGYRLMMMMGLAVLVTGMFMAGLVPVYGVVMLSFFMAGLAKSIFDPAVQAYLAARVPYERRGMVIGVLEFSWAASSLVGIPMVGIFMEGFGWRTPFFVLGGLGLFGMLALWPLFSGDRKIQEPVDPSQKLWLVWTQLGRERRSLGVLGFSFFISAANDNLFVVYGAWLETAFGLSVMALGAGTAVIGIAELLGETLTASFADRLGLKRSVIVGLALTSISYVLLPLVGNTFLLSMTGLFVVFLTFEFTIVTSLSLSTELLPGTRATMMSGFLAVASVGRVIGALIGGPIWLVGGIAATSLVSAAITGLALASLLWGLQRWP